MVLDRRYYERKHFEPTATEDVLGGAQSWETVDKTTGKSPPSRFATSTSAS